MSMLDIIIRLFLNWIYYLSISANALIDAVSEFTALNIFQESLI